MINIFIYNVVYIKCDCSKLRRENDQMVLIATPYCLNELTDHNRACFDAIHEISRDFQRTCPIELEKIVISYVEQHGAENIRLFTNEDSAQLVSANLREKYNIPGDRVSALLPFVNKVISKTQLGDVVRMPRFFHFDKSKYAENKSLYLRTLEEKLGFPMFAKPVDLVSSVETHYIADMQELMRISERIISHSYDFEIDEFIEGDLFHCDALIIDGIVKFFMIGKCSFALARFFEGKPVGSIPIADQNRFNQLRSFCDKIFEKLGCTSGAYHLEAFLDAKTQEFVFLEIAARTGGALITKVYEKIFDVNIEEVNYLIQMGRINDIKVAKKNLYGGFLNFPKIKGIVCDIKKPTLTIPHEFIAFVQIDDELEQAQNLLDISSSIIFWDESYQKVEESFEILKNYHPLKLIATS